MTDSERASIVNEAVEKALLLIPDVIGNLITNHIGLLKMNREFYETHKEFLTHKDIVQAAVEATEGQNPGLDYKAILDRAIPVIKNWIDTTNKLDNKTVPKPVRDLRSFEFGNGEL